MNLAVGVSSLWRGSSFSMIVGGVCMFRKLAFLYELRFLWHARPCSLSSLVSHVSEVQVGRFCPSVGRDSPRQSALNRDEPR